MKIAAIPTKYAGVQFRSRLEARWAAMFDLLGWKWEYEPIDLNGYIPDFIVTKVSNFTLHELFEVKPAGDVRAMQDAEHKIDTSGWWELDGFSEYRNACVVGIHPDIRRFRFSNGDGYGHTTWQHHTQEPGDSVYHTSMLENWREAGNRVQWKAPNTGSPATPRYASPQYVLPPQYVPPPAAVATRTSPLPKDHFHAQSFEMMIDLFGELGWDAANHALVEDSSEGLESAIATMFVEYDEESLRYLTDSMRCLGFAVPTHILNARLREIRADEAERKAPRQQ